MERYQQLAAPDPRGALYMNEEYANLAGELASVPSKQALNAALVASGFETNVGEYAIRIAGFNEFVFRNLGGDMGKPLVNASHESAQTLSDFAAGVSSALAKAGIRHRFEIYDADDTLHSSHDHEWAY